MSKATLLNKIRAATGKHGLGINLQGIKVSNEGNKEKTPIRLIVKRSQERNPIVCGNNNFNDYSK